VLAEAARRRVTSSGPVNLAFGGRTSLLELIDEIQNQPGRPVEVEHVAPCTGDAKDSQADNTRLLGPFPTSSPVPLGTGIADTISWFRAVGSRSS